MKKQILNLGKALNKAEQKEINGGSGRYVICQMEVGGCPCNCSWIEGQCVTQEVFQTSCD